ncbi:DotA/TraY family protein, partial [Agrobacterium salinitolerans]|nr:DotA/TraY family protein [Agrobacterium salinitolerans]
MIDLLADPKCTDIAWSWILVLFGTEGTTCAGKIIGAADVNTPYANAFAVLTSVLTFLGGLFMAYHTVAGIVSTASTGKVLGEKWHQIWAPLRIVLGFGLLIPVGGGFSSVHYILRDVVGVAAVQLANNVIKVYAATAFTDVEKASSASKVSTMAGADFANKFFEKEVCAGVITEMSSGLFTIWPYKAINAPTPTENIVSDVADADPSSLLHGQGNVRWNYKDCGSLVLTNISGRPNDGIFSTEAAQVALKDFDSKRKAATIAMAEEIEGLMDYKALGRFIDAHGDSLESSSSAVIKKLREEGTIAPGIQDKLDAAAAKWNRVVGEAASDVFLVLSKKAREGLSTDIPDYGFMIAGSYERSLSAVSGLVSGVANTVFASTQPDFDEETNTKIKFANEITRSSKAVDNKVDGSQTPSADDNSDPVTGVLSTIIPKNLTNMWDGKVSSDPVGDMIMFGNNLLTMASWSLVAIAVLKGIAMGAGTSVAGLIGIGGAFQGVVDYLSHWFSWLLMIMIIVGLMHSFVLPMLPMIMIFTMGVSWLVMFLEGAVAGVLWAFIFIRMDGQEFFDQKQSPGVGLLFNLLLRPALGMLAFCGMLLLLPALLNALNLVWKTAFSLQTGNHGTISLVFIWQWVAQIVMFCWMQWTLTLRITSLIPTIADRVGHWMGVSSTSGYGDSQETTANVGAMIAASQALSKAPLTGGQKPRSAPGGGGGGG